MMNWASRKRTIYILGIVVFFGIVLGVPLATWLYEPPSCFDGRRNQGETVSDKGGPCALLDERSLLPYSVLWSRAFPVRAGAYNATAYVENPNASAGARDVSYRFRFYDNRGVLVAEREGVTSIMPGSITPVFEGAIGSGNRLIARTFFEFTSSPVWERVEDSADALSFGSKVVSAADSSPRLTVQIENTSVRAMLNPVFVAVIFDTAGNAFAASATTLSRIDAGEGGEIIFTWSDPFPKAVGRIDVLPFLKPIVVTD